MAVSLWFYVNSTSGFSDDRRTILTKLTYLNTPAQLSLRGGVHEVEVEVEGAAVVLERMKPDAVTCEVDIKGLAAGRYRMPLRTVVPPNVTVVRVTPSVVDVELIQQIGRLLRVEVALPDDMPEGRYLESVEIVPKDVNVRGAERDLAKIDGLKVTPTFAELDAGGEILLPVSAVQSEPFEEDVTFEPRQVKLRAVLATGNPRKRVPVNVRLLGKPNADYAVRAMTTDPAEVMVQGPEAALKSISAVDTETVNIAGISEPQSLVVPLRRPDGEVSLGDVQSVKLSIALEPITAQRQFKAMPLSVPSGWRASPPAVDVTVEAPSSRMASFDPAADMKVFVDTSGLVLKKVDIPVRVALSADEFKVVGVSPQIVTVTAEANK
jgi:YbbR domain-containing protein